MASKETPNKPAKPQDTTQILKSEDTGVDMFHRLLMSMGIIKSSGMSGDNSGFNLMDFIHRLAYPGADFHMKGDLESSFGNFSRLAETLKSGSTDPSGSRSYSLPSARLNFDGFSASDFRRQGDSGNWSKFDLDTLPKVGSAKNIRLDGSFEQAFKIVLASEGGFSNHKADRGGATIYGIASKANPREYRQIMDRLEAGDKQGAMQITMDTYKTKYWDKAGIDNIKDPAARLVAFDAAINHGAGYATKMIARTGPEADDMLRYRATTYRNIITNDPSQQVFAKGWNNRLAKLDTITDNNPSGVVVAAADTAIANASTSSKQALNTTSASTLKEGAIAVASNIDPASNADAKDIRLAAAAKGPAPIPS
jgi:lysozyme family protein